MYVRDPTVRTRSYPPAMQSCVLIASLALASGCRTHDVGSLAAPVPATWSGAVETWGTLREALHDGHDEARVALAEVAERGVYAIGALAGLRGEISVEDGEVWVTLGDALEPATRRSRDPRESA